MYPETSQSQFLSILPDFAGETGAECEIILPEYCPNVLRILQTTVNVSVQTCTCSGNRVAVDGKAEYWILYLSEDGKEVYGLSQSVPFSFQGELKQGEGAWFTPKITPENCSARALNPRKIYARCTLQICGSADGSQTLPPLPEEGKYEIKRCRLPGMTRIATAEKPLRITDEWENPAPENCRILKKRICFRETEQKALTDRRIVKADMIMELLCAYADGAPVTVCKTVPVSQILDLPDTEGEVFCKTGFSLSSFEITEEETGDGKRWNYDVEVLVSCRAYGQKTAEWAADAYCTKKETECTKTPLLLHGCRSVSEKGTVKERVEIAPATELLHAEIFPRLQKTFYRQEEDRLVCEGLWICNLLLSDGDGFPCAQRKEIPFLLEIPSEGCRNPVRNDTELTIYDFSAVLTDGTHVEFRGNYDWSGLIFTGTESEALLEVRDQADRPRTEDTVVLYYATEGESVWEIAKAHACNYGALRKENGLEEDSIYEDKMLIILR